MRYNIVNYKINKYFAYTDIYKWMYIVFVKFISHNKCYNCKYKLIYTVPYTSIGKYEQRRL